MLTVLFVHALYFPYIHAALDYVEIKLVETTSSCNFWARELAQRVEI